VTRKKKLLEDLQRRIRRECGEDKVWFYGDERPKSKNITGFLGESELFFLALNPSQGTPNATQFKLFYGSLENNKLQDAHLTDLIKIKKSNKDRKELIGNEVCMGRQIGYLMEELRIIRPKLIVILGGECEKLFRKVRFENPEIFNLLKNTHIERITHYSATRYNDEHNHGKVFIDEMKQIKQIFGYVK
jgi:hypothetical protein